MKFIKPTSGEISLLIIVLVLVVLLLALSKNCKAVEFPSYSYVDLSQLANDPDKYNSEEVQVKGKVLRVDEYTGVYGGTYYGLVMGDITIYAYQEDFTSTVVAGDTVLVDGRFLKFGRYGGTGHNYMIVTHKLERLN